MDRMNLGGGGPEAAAEPEALEFVRFCHRRRRVGWPELYDEMCAVAGRGLYRGYGAEELAQIGIGFGLFQLPALAGLVARVVAEDVERRHRSAEALRLSLAVAENVEPRAVTLLTESTRSIEPEPAEVGKPDHGAILLAVAAGA